MVNITTVTCLGSLPLLEKVVYHLNFNALLIPQIYLRNIQCTKDINFITVEIA